MDYRDGYYTINGAKIYYKLFPAASSSQSSSKKLIVLHGGPGATHDADLPLSGLADRGITVLFYDQYGSGKSDETPDLASRLTTEYYADELDQVRKTAFGEEEKVYMMGHSWGGMLGLAYAVKHQNHMKALISTGGLSSVPYYTSEVNKIIDALPDRIKSVIHKYESVGDFNHPEYTKAVDYFYHQHLCRLDRWPDELHTSIKSIEERKVYKTWWGPNEFRAKGPLKDWDITKEIRDIRIPTLVTTGRYDEVSPNVARLIQENVSNSRLVLFENSSHCPMWEEPQLYLNTVEQFINRN